MSNHEPLDSATFRGMVLDHYAESARDLPWRRTRDPYRILVSEIMLQQTQVSRVLVKYEPFLDAFPDTATLAAAPLRDVLSLWKGLGYNRRCLALQSCAQMIVREFDGVMPGNLTELRRLPGVGAATAGAICAFAFDLPVAFIETNIRAVFLHHFFPDRPSVSDREVLPLVEATLDRTSPRRWFYALMDLGVAIKASQTNPSRRSSHYAVQSPFPGSRRELRARVLHVVLSEGPLSSMDIAAKVPDGDPALVAEVIEDLTAEGFFKEDRGRCRIA